MSCKPISVLGIAIVLAILVIAGCDKNTPPTNIISVGILKHSSAIPIIVAQREHFFENRGLKVSLHPLTPSQHMPALLHGDVQILSPSSFPVIFSTAQQNPEKIIAYMTGGEATNGDILYGLVVPKDSTMSSLSDLLGKTIGSASKFTIVNLRNVLGSKLGDVKGNTKIREISDRSALLNALQQGAIDAAVLDQPALSSREVSEHFKVIEPNFRAKYMGNNPYWSGSGIANKNWVHNNKKDFEAYLAALDDALAFCKRDPLKAKSDFVEHFAIKGLQPEAIGMYVYPSSHFAPPHEFVQALANSLITNGMLSTGFNFTDLFYQ